MKKLSNLDAITVCNVFHAFMNNLDLEVKTDWTYRLIDILKQDKDAQKLIRKEVELCKSKKTYTDLLEFTIGANAISWGLFSITGPSRDVDYFSDLYYEMLDFADQNLSNKDAKKFAKAIC